MAKSLFRRFPDDAINREEGEVATPDNYDSGLWVKERRGDVSVRILSEFFEFSEQTPTGYKYGTSAYQTSGVPINWVGVLSDLLTENNDCPIKVSLAPDDISEWAAVVNFDFSSIPNDATIDGIEVKTYGYFWDDTEYSAQASIQLRTGIGTTIGNAKAMALTYANGVPGEVTHGSSSDKWGATLTPAVVKASGFGVGIRVTNVGGFATCNAGLYWVQMRVTYTEASGGGTKSLMLMGIG